jgi:hypothetical protein
VYVQLVITYRHGREEDETMGISFKKELIVDRAQVSIELLTTYMTKYKSA